MGANTLVEKSTGVLELLEFIFANNVNRQEYLENRERMREIYNVEEVLKDNQDMLVFDRFVEDDEIWESIHNNKPEKLYSLINIKFPELLSGEIQNLFSSNVFAVNHVLVGASSVALAVAILKANAAVIG